MFCSVQGNACVIQSVVPSLRLLVSHLFIADCCLKELCNTIIKFKRMFSIEACYRCFVAPHKYFNGIATVCAVAHRLSMCTASSQDLIHITFIELFFGNAYHIANLKCTIGKHRIVEFFCRILDMLFKTRRIYSMQ